MIAKIIPTRKGGQRVVVIENAWVCEVRISCPTWLRG